MTQLSSAPRAGANGHPAPPPDAHPTALAAIATLRQCERFLRDLDDGVYASPCEMIQGSTIGQHVRHALDHYVAAMCALDGEAIDYDHRERDTPVERSREEALRRVGALCARLASVDGAAASREAEVRVMLDSSGTEAALRSTIGRELAFATHHATHHHAMMHAIAHRFGLAAPEGFGRAPATIHHDRSRQNG